MSQKILTFSVPLGDHKNLALVERVKEYCAVTGKSFTWIILQALASWEKENIDA